MEPYLIASILDIPRALGNEREGAPEDRLEAAIDKVSRRQGLDPYLLREVFDERHGSDEYLLYLMRRASGQSVCERCNKTYLRHPDFRGLLDSERRPYTHILCNGDIVKL